MPSIKIDPHPMSSPWWCWGGGDGYVLPNHVLPEVTEEHDVCRSVIRATYVCGVHGSARSGICPLKNAAGAVVEFSLNRSNGRERGYGVTYRV